MGLEYKIKFPVKDKKRLENFLERLSTLSTNETTIALEPDGFYFCDNCHNSPAASDIFYRLVKEALSQTAEVIIYEL